MLLHHTLERLHELRLRGMAAALEEQVHHAAATDLSFEDRLGLMGERELTWRDDRRLRRLLQEARLRVDASMEDVDFRAPRGLDRSVLMRLGSCDWIRQHQVVLVVGPTGAGKTYLAWDRVVHGAHKLILKGGSMRKVEAARRMKESAPD